MSKTTDKPTVDFNFDAYTTDDDLPDFAFVVGGKRHTIPNARTLNGLDFMEAAVQGDNVAVYHVLANVLDDEQRQAVRDASPTVPAIGEFVRAYLAHGGLAAGN